jgi:ankyrin repeat protein
MPGPLSLDERLLRASRSHDLADAQRLINEGANVDGRDQSGSTALMNAAMKNDPEMVELLLSCGADVNLKDDIEWTALHYAAQNYCCEIAEKLIAGGAEIDPQDAHGNTPLAKAVFNSQGRGELISLLLKSGADAWRVNKYGVSPLGLANTIANYDVKRFFAGLTGTE